MASSGSTPNIYVITKENKTTTITSYSFPGAIQTGQDAKQTFYIVNYHPDASSNNSEDKAHDLYSIKLKLQCSEVPSEAPNDLSYINVFLGDDTTASSAKLSFGNNDGLTNEGAVKTANGADTLKGCGKTIPSCSTANDEYIAITVQAAPADNAKAGSYKYTLSISGKYT